MKKKETIVTFYTDKPKPIELNCEIAKTIFEKMKGLMYREELAKDRGMVFTFLFSNHRFFWMKNVKIPLDIIFVNSKLKIIWIAQADISKGPFHDTFWSHGLCKYVVETNKGFCKNHGIEKGNIIKIN